MSERGIMGIAVLWLLMAVSALSFSVLAMAKGYQSRGRSQLELQRALSLARMAAVLERESNFNMSVRERTFKTGKVRLEREYGDSKDDVKLKCVVKAGRLEKECEIGWKRIGGVWRATYWKEL